MTKPAVRIDLCAGIARLVRRTIMLMHVMPEMRCLRRFLLVLAIASRNRKGGIQRKQHGKNEGEAGTHGNGVYQGSSRRDSTVFYCMDRMLLIDLRCIRNPTKQHHDQE